MKLRTTSEAIIKALPNLKWADLQAVEQYIMERSNPSEKVAEHVLYFLNVCAKFAPIPEVFAVEAKTMTAAQFMNMYKKCGYDLLKTYFVMWRTHRHLIENIPHLAKIDPCGRPFYTEKLKELYETVIEYTSDDVSKYAFADKSRNQRILMDTGNDALIQTHKEFASMLYSGLLDAVRPDTEYIKDKGWCPINYFPERLNVFTETTVSERDMARVKYYYAICGCRVKYSLEDLGRWRTNWGPSRK